MDLANQALENHLAKSIKAVGLLIAHARTVFRYVRILWYWRVFDDMKVLNVPFKLPVLTLPRGAYLQMDHHNSNELI
jgi:hypothetical protein